MPEVRSGQVNRREGDWLRSGTPLSISAVPIRLILRPLQQLRQLSDVGRYSSRLITGEQLAGGSSARLSLEKYVSQRLTIVVADDETTSVVFLYVPRWREAASRGVQS